MQALRADDIWCVFGAHLLNVKWARIYALAHGMEFYYRHNSYPPFGGPGGTPELYYENVSTINEEQLAQAQVSHYYYKYLDMSCRHTFKPEGYATVSEFHQALLRQIYRLKPLVTDYLEASSGLKECTQQPYIALHVRRGDKVNGPDAEIKRPMTLERHLEVCAQVRMKVGLNRLVLSTDTEDTVASIKHLNQAYGFDLHYVASERPRNDWKQSSTMRILRNEMDPAAAQQMYLDCFVDFELLLRAHVLVGDFISGFSLAAAEMRNNPLDVHVSTEPPLWAIQPEAYLAQPVASV